MMSQSSDKPPTIFIDNKACDEAENFTYLGSAIANNLSLNTERYM